MQALSSSLALLCWVVDHVSTVPFLPLGVIMETCQGVLMGGKAAPGGWATQSYGPHAAKKVSSILHEGEDPTCILGAPVIRHLM